MVSLLSSALLCPCGDRREPDVPGMSTPVEPASARQTATERLSLFPRKIHPLPSSTPPPLPSSFMGVSRNDRGSCA